MKRILPLALPLALLPGCIAWEIRDEMRTVNQRLADVQPVLVETRENLVRVNQDINTTNTQLAQVQTLLAQTNTQLTDVYARLGRVDEHLVAVGGVLGETNPKLVSVDTQLERMRILNEINPSLAQVNAALAPLSKSMGALGGAMSFLGLSDSGADLLDEPDPEPAPATAPEAEEGAPAEASEVAAATGPRRSDPFAGTWVMVYPPPKPPQTIGRIVVVSSDGSYLEAQEGMPLTTGRWARKDRTLTMTPDAAPGGAPAREMTVEVITLTTRTLTVRNAEEIRVFARP